MKISKAEYSEGRVGTNHFGKNVKPMKLQESVKHHEAKLTLTYRLLNIARANFEMM